MRARRLKFASSIRGADYYMAVNAIRLNYADGVVVKNDVPNGFF